MTTSLRSRSLAPVGAWVLVLLALGCDPPGDADAGPDAAAPSDAGVDAGRDEDAGVDAGSDAGSDGGSLCAPSTVSAACGDIDLERFDRACGSAPTDCRACLDAELADGIACDDLVRACAGCFCPVPPPTGGPSPDAGVDAGADAGALDAAVADGGVAACGGSGQLGATCRGGTACVAPTTCQSEFTTLPMGGGPATLGNLVGIRTGTEDPDHPGDYIEGELSDIPLRFAPGGLCTPLCDSTRPDEGCGDCARCSAQLGGSPGYAPVFTATTLVPAGEGDGVCRPTCVFDEATRGGCEDGYTCDARESVCLEACVSDAQCNLLFAPSRMGGVVAVERPGAPYTCDLDTGRCERTAPVEARAGDECTSDTECPFPGECHVGRCVTTGCTDDASCGGCSSCDHGSCVDACATAADCRLGAACTNGRCAPRCSEDAQCAGSMRCSNLPTDFGTDRRCEPFCDADASDGVDPLATACGASEHCAAAAGAAHGFCRAGGGLCSLDGECSATEACRYENADFLGRCVPGCEDSDDCTAPEECRIQPGSARGTCRSPGEPCAQPPGFGGSDRSLLGDAQCVLSETCNSAEPRVLGSCE